MENSVDGNAEARRKARVKARWEILRQALTGEVPLPKTHPPSNGSDRGYHTHSMNAFPGFQVLDRTVLSPPPPRSEIFGNDDNVSHEVVEYRYTSRDGAPQVQFKAREVALQQQSATMKSRLEELLSHRTHGVDNTGNVRVWDSEGVLAVFLLSTILDEDPSCDTEALIETRNALRDMITAHGDRDHPTVEECNVLELGCGQAGLAGLALASLGSASGGSTRAKRMNIMLTDGHPKCIANNRACADMIAKGGDTVRAEILLWDSSPNGKLACANINQVASDNHNSVASKSQSLVGDGSFDICLASDCVHFQDFHDGLLLTIARTLSVNGIALLCQPARGASLENFMSLVDFVNGRGGGVLLDMTLIEEFVPKVSSLHAGLVSNTNDDSTYDPDRHRPLLLVMRKMRILDEVVDGSSVQLLKLKTALT